MRFSTIVVSSAVLLAGLSAAFPVEGESTTGIEARDYDEEPAPKDPPPPYRPSSHTSHHPRSFYEQSHSELTRRDPPLPPGFPYVRDPTAYIRHIDAWDTRRQYSNHEHGNRAPTPRPSTPPHSPTPTPQPELTRRLDPPLQPGFPYPNDPGAYNRNLDAWDNRRQYDNQGHGRSQSPSRSHSPTPRPSAPPRYRRAFYDLD